jgi:hypothetical protein
MDTKKQEKERVSLELVEQARKRERQRTTLPSATKRIEREKWIQRSKRKRDHPWS